MQLNHYQYSELIRWGISIGVPALAGLLGVAIGAWLSGRREKKQRRYAFIEKQLNQFYSPLMGIRSEIRMRSELRVRIQRIADIEWHKLCDKYGDDAIQEDARKHLKNREAKFDKIIEYDNRQLAKELMPAYRQMVKIFRDKMWLADPDTKEHLPKLLEFVEIWERWLAKSLPREVIEALGHEEKDLDTFYAHLQNRLIELRNKIKKARA